MMTERLNESAKAAMIEHCVSHVRLEKFAELIVRECADIADIAEPYKANDSILKHFGIEE